MRSAGIIKVAGAPRVAAVNYSIENTKYKQLEINSPEETGVRYDREGGSEVAFSLDGKSFSSMDGERPIRTPALDMCIGSEDLSPRWSEMKVSVLEQPKFGQRDYAVRRFAMIEDGREKATVSFEVVVYNDQQTATRVLAGTLGKMGFLRLTRLDVGDMGAVVEVAGHPSRRLRALMFVERNVMGLIMLSTTMDRQASDSWLISMGRLMASRTS